MRFMGFPRRARRPSGRGGVRFRRWLGVLAAAAAVLAVAPAVSAAAGPALYHEPYRPQYHFTPARNWINDPNGPIWYRGQYHMFFQYDPHGSEWGDISWGHAVSDDLVHWKELPVAIPADEREYIFSGGVVDDATNSSGLGTAADPPLVAVYTSTDRVTGRQAQALAYSTDAGLTWTKYAGNPVLDIGSQNFRDPKVFWWAPTHSWRMVVALSDQHRLSIWSSPDLTSWTHLSDFGPAGATGGVWECPNLFPLAVDGDSTHRKWVMVVGINPGAPAGGSGDQYFVGDFDGTTFTPDDAGTYTPPTGTPLASFDGGTYAPWTTTGTAFGDAPATGTLPDQMPVSGWTGPGYASSYHGADGTTGTLTSPPFTVTHRWLDLQIGGGHHPSVPGTPADVPPPAGETAVEVVVDGQVVASATGSDSEALDWAALDLGAYQGRTATIRVVDTDTGGWGHVLLDTVILADAPALSSTQRAHWVDFGADFYAATSFNDLPDGRQVLIGWMNNWNYAGDIPTDPWRGAMSVPRQLALRTVDGQVRLVTQPVGELLGLRRGPATPLRTGTVTGTRPAGIRGATLDLSAVLQPGTAQRFGVDVLTGNGVRTRIGYDVATGELFIDRTASGRTDFNPAFGGVQRAPLPLDGRALQLRVLVDTSSVEVFADGGRVAMTDRVFPDGTATGVHWFADGGSARVLTGLGWTVGPIH